MVLISGISGISGILALASWLALISFFLSFLRGTEPWMREHLVDVVPLGHVPIKHAANKVDAFFAHDERDAQIAIHNLVDTVKGVLLVDDGVEEDTQGPYVLLSTTIRFASQDLGRSII